MFRGREKRRAATFVSCCPLLASRDRCTRRTRHCSLPTDRPRCLAYRCGFLVMVPLRGSISCNSGGWQAAGCQGRRALHGDARVPGTFCERRPNEARVQGCSGFLNLELDHNWVWDCRLWCSMTHMPASCVCKHHYLDRVGPPAMILPTSFFLLGRCASVDTQELLVHHGKGSTGRRRPSYTLHVPASSRIGRSLEGTIMLFAAAETRLVHQ